MSFRRTNRRQFIPMCIRGRHTKSIVNVGLYPSKPGFRVLGFRGTSVGPNAPINHINPGKPKNPRHSRKRTCNNKRIRVTQPATESYSYHMTVTFQSQVQRNKGTSVTQVFLLGPHEYYASLIWAVKGSKWMVGGELEGVNGSFHK